MVLFKQILDPIKCFKHELDNYNRNYFKLNNPVEMYHIVDENGNRVSDNIYILHGYLDYAHCSANISIVKKVCEKRYSQETIDHCRKEHEKNGTKQYEWHYETVDVAIDMETGREIYEVHNDYWGEHHLSVYENLVVESKANERTAIVYKDGTVLWPGSTGYSNLFNTEKYLFFKASKNYSTNIDTVIKIDKTTGEMETF